MKRRVRSVGGRAGLRRGLNNRAKMHAVSSGRNTHEDCVKAISNSVVEWMCIYGRLTSIEYICGWARFVNMFPLCFMQVSADRHPHITLFVII